VIPVLVPTTDVNSETATLVEWMADDATQVTSGDPLVELETSKSIVEVPCPADGFVLHALAEGEELRLDLPVAHIFESLAALEAFRAESTAKAQAAEAATSEVRATAKAKAKALELGVDLATLSGGGLITVKAVQAAAEASAPVDYSKLPEPLKGKPGCQRVLIIGGGRGATQVIDIFNTDEGQCAVAILDDGRDKWGEVIYEVPVVGGTDRMTELFEAGAFDAVIVAISTSIVARVKFRKMCEAAGIPMANAIDKTTKVATHVTMGTGNVICAFCQIGTSTVMGNNNFLSAYNSFDHHNHLGNDISTGPGVATSSRVTLGNQCRLGTGIFIQPGVELGEGVRVASGSVLIKSVPAHHAVKTKVVTTQVVPLRK
jgi:acetyltransferase-like isoleucine patch superfamily enzyme